MGYSLALESAEGNISVDLLKASTGHISLKALLGSIKIADINASNGIWSWRLSI